MDDDEQVVLVNVFHTEDWSAERLPLGGTVLFIYEDDSATIEVL